MQFVGKYLLYLTLFRTIVGSPQIVLHLTDWVSDMKTSPELEHDCIYITALEQHYINTHQILSYCLTEWPFEWNITKNTLDQNYTFTDLYDQHITSEQLYLWSAPMDVIERYEFYSNQRLLSNEISIVEMDVFYNCTSPRFGPQCQYSLDISQPSHLSLTTIVQQFYKENYEPSILTCYQHIECDLGSASICLSWHQICDGHVHCLNGIDEEYCWKLRIGKCRENEYRCRNGQCIPQEFYQDNKFALECLDQSDQMFVTESILHSFASYEPIFINEDVQITRSNRVTAYSLSYSSGVERSYLLDRFMSSVNVTSVGNDCWIAFQCRLESKCQSRMNITCPYMFFIPNAPVAFGHIYFAYRRDFVDTNLRPHYICYNDRFCYAFFDNITSMIFNNLTCRKPDDWPGLFDGDEVNSTLWFYVARVESQLSRCNTILYNDSTVCNQSIMYQCRHSLKCIFLDQLCDGIIDCNFEDDEKCSLVNGTCEVMDSDALIRCQSTKQCISPYFVKYSACDDVSKDLKVPANRIPFSIICNGYTQLDPMLIDGQNETDETNCQDWPCNNIYTRCDHRWNCMNGADELNCNFKRPFWCPRDHHLCVSATNYTFTCLSIEKANDGKIDCVGATDEPSLCRSTQYRSEKNFYCNDGVKDSCILSTELCSDKHRCTLDGDARLCYPTQEFTGTDSVCEGKYHLIRTGIQSFFCEQMPALTNAPKNTLFTLNTKSFQTPIETVQRCHRGLPLRIWLDSENAVSREACLCPPSSYGKSCQYDNERVSLTIQFSAYSNSRSTLFAILVSLIDNDSHERRIYSYQQHTYLYLRDCSKKFNIYLLYPIRPKHPSMNYSVHIDIFEKISLIYRGSYRLPIKYPFLPVNRIAIQLTIPGRRNNLNDCFDSSCQHGQCVKYTDNSHGSTTFCLCHEGWHGKDCSIPHNCQCSSGSFCIGVAANNKSVCICSINQWGSRCLLRSNPCRADKNELCLYGGRCVPIEEQVQRSDTYFCICRKGFYGKQCEHTQKNITLSFHRDISLPQSIVVHFVDVAKDLINPTSIGSILQKVSLYQQTITIYWSNSFHIAFVELIGTYYLVTVQPEYNKSANYDSFITPTDRCPHITELNQALRHLHPISRMKYYQNPCRKNAPSLKCFHDDQYFCLCYNYNQQNLSNCFNFYSQIHHTCNGFSECENNGRCIQDKSTCPQLSVCVCPKCFFGTRCQFNSHLFGLSLDAILGYHIQPNTNVFDQPRIVIFSLIIAIIIDIVGIVNGILSVVTFKNKESDKVGCDLYLIGSSVATLCVIIIFILKFNILLISQFQLITNELVLKIQCYSLDFLLNVSINMHQYLNACVAYDRSYTVMKGVSFDKRKSRRMVKYVIIFLLIGTMTTLGHDPIHRRLLFENYDSDDENEEKRIWCTVTYSSQLQKYNSAINIIHYSVPFLINLTSVVIIIIQTTRQRFKAQNQQQKLTYQKVLQQQYHQHRNLLVAPAILVLLALPRLTLSFLSNCMTASENPWLLLIGYFISFIPTTITLLIFVVPSKLYRKQYKKSIKSVQNVLKISLRWGVRTV
ncbi:unnamed protein product [Adineta ricciae]|uniref:Uncharacterized protein n=1 Tax=Adineta ricciae TaxID=249248 RepID=A0A815EQ47_ADIRI|nr:unnamed protein product [Adineta ricciae]